MRDNRKIQDIRSSELTLSSGKQDYETIVLSANYIQGFLQAVQ